ncbi:GEVED domain-containing protein [Kordia sp.]|uniref:GEVED domain-containing protein n=1 Tax=Kordia sp. TaxID=1965332 RepID=UPI0025BC7548|nr:GEVED domain-containing protein [Kordia sp.]MCH2194278.1 GEVED domain-containing protein [Kordia sp.]
MKFKITLILLLGVLTLSFAQDREKASYIGTADTHTYVPSIASRLNEITPSTIKPPSEVKDGRYFKNRIPIIPGKGKQQDILSKNPHPLSQKISGRTPDITWVGAVSNSQPTDPALAVGPNHVFVVFNTGFAIYDKDGNELVGQTNPNPAIFPSSGCCDLTVSYDPVATSVGNSNPGRWVLSFLGSGAQIAVSDGPDPVNDGWNVYTINTVNDYNKLSVWSDGYYLTDVTGSGDRVYAMDRQAMLDGEPAANVSIQGFGLPNLNVSGFASVQVLNISDSVYPNPGNATVVFFQDDAYPNQDDDSVKFWDIDVDFDNPLNSTVSNPQEIIVTPFTSVFDGGSFSNLRQPGGQDIDALQGIVMNQAQYKKFPSYESAIFNFVIDVGTGGNEQAAIRWYEFRRNSPSDPWMMAQEGTFSDPDGRHFWHASMIMDIQGNIGMGFSAMGNATTGNGSNEFVSSYYTGRFANDPGGTMTIAPQLIAAGNGNIPGSERYGDYGKIDLDPSNFKRMYFINELMFPNRANVVGRFQIAPDLDTDIGVVNIDAPVDGTLTNSEQITVSIFNYGNNPVSGFDVTYQIDGGTIITETYTGTINSTETVSFTFTTPADLSVEGQTYTLVASTVLSADEENLNDTFTKNVTHLFAEDVGVTALVTPSTGSLSDTEIVTVEITNFGTSTQTSIPVFYMVDGVTENETYTGSIAPGATDSYAFTATADLSTLGDYTFEIGTALGSDSDTSNDAITTIITNIICMPDSDCAGFGDGVTQLQLADQDIATNCGPDGYSDDTSTIFNFNLDDDNPFNGVLQLGYVNSNYTIWIDFNDNNEFETDEIISSGLVAAADTDFNFTVDFDIIPNVLPGLHRMRVRGGDENSGGTVSDPCGDLQYGRTNDYTANVIQTLSVEDNVLNASNFTILDKGNNIFDISLSNTNIDRMILSVFDISGKQIFSHGLVNEDKEIRYNLNMSYVASGVYLVRLRKGNTELVKKLVVK